MTPSSYAIKTEFLLGAINPCVRGFLSHSLNCQFFLAFDLQNIPLDARFVNG